MTASRDPRAHIGWGVSSYYPGRVHPVPHGCAVGLCRMPVHENCHRRAPEPGSAPSAPSRGSPRSFRPSLNGLNQEKRHDQENS
jgi:hypothetical protein